MTMEHARHTRIDIGDAPRETKEANMSSLLKSLLDYFASPLVYLLIIIMIIYMAFSWLIAFNIVNLRNPVMAQIHGTVRRIVEPILNPLRRFIPPIGGLDIAFLVAFLGLLWVHGFVIPALGKLLS